MYQKLDFAIGFFIAIAFLSSVLLALTFIYVSRLKPRTASKLANVPAKAGASDPEELPESHEQPGVIAIEDPATDVRINEDPPNPTTATSVSSKVAGPDDTAIVDQIKTAVAEVKDDELAGPSSGDLSQETPSPGLAPSTEVLAQGPSLETKEMTVLETVTAKVAQAEIASKSDPQQQAMSISLIEPGAKQAASSERPSNSSGPSITVVNESEARDTMADEPKGDQPRDVKQDTSFSDLFTEDTEETEATKLGKELSDIDAGDIAKMTQNLANQLKVRRPASK